MASTPASTRDLFAALSALIDLPQNVRKIVITVGVGEVARVECEFPPILVGELPTVRRYTLQPIERPDA